MHPHMPVKAQPQPAALLTCAGICCTCLHLLYLHSRGKRHLKDPTNRGGKSGKKQRQSERFWAKQNRLLSSGPKATLTAPSTNHPSTPPPDDATLKTPAVSKASWTELLAGFARTINTVTALRVAYTCTSSAWHKLWCYSNLSCSLDVTTSTNNDHPTTQDTTPAEPVSSTTACVAQLE